MLRKDDFAILGAGEQVTRAKTEYDLQVRFRYVGETFDIPVRQIPLGEGRGVELLVGAKEQKGSVESVSAMRSKVKIKRADVEGDRFRRALMNGKELTVVAFGDGISTFYVAMISHLARCRYTR